MRFEDVVTKLDRSGIAYTVHEHEPHLTTDAADASGLFDMNSALKTMLLEADGKIIAAVLAGRDRVSFGALARTCGVLRSTLHPIEASRVAEIVGDIPGGVGPLQGSTVIVVVDEKVRQMDTVTCGAGRPDRTLEMRAEALINACNGMVAPITQR